MFLEENSYAIFQYGPHNIVNITFSFYIRSLVIHTHQIEITTFIDIKMFEVKLFDSYGIHRNVW